MQILTDHIVVGNYPAAEFFDGQKLTTIADTELMIGIAEDGSINVMAPDGGTVATVTIVDVPACSSVVHVIDTILIAGSSPDAAPEMAMEEPSDEGADGEDMADDEETQEPAEEPAEEPEEPMASDDMPADCPSVVDVASGVEDLSSLVDAVVAAELVEALSNGMDEITVFAPVNAAFEAAGDVPAEALPEVRPSTCSDNRNALANLPSAWATATVCIADEVAERADPAHARRHRHLCRGGLDRRHDAADGRRLRAHGRRR